MADKLDKIVEKKDMGSFEISHEELNLPSKGIDRITFSEKDFKSELTNVKSDDVMEFLIGEFGSWENAGDFTRDDRSRISRGTYERYKSGLVKLSFQRYEVIFSSGEKMMLKPLHKSVEVQYRTK